MLKIMFPPRAKNAFHPDRLNEYEDMGMLGQPKLNGSHGVLYMNEKELEFRNRHKEIMTNVAIKKDEFRTLYSGKGQMILCGEYLNKNKKHINGVDFNHKYILFDIIMYNGIHLLGQSFKQRQELLNRLFPNTTDFDGLIRKVNGMGMENIYIVNSFEDGFVDLYRKMEDIDLYEGLVLKKKYSGLEMGLREDNNHLTQVKCRKPTKNYSF